MRTADCPESTGYSGRKAIGGKARASRLVLLLLVLGSASLLGCTITVPLAKPIPSQFQYAERREEPVQVVVRDARPVTERKLSKGTMSVEFVGGGEDLSFITEALVAEMKARGLNSVAGTGGDDPNALLIEVDRFYFRNRRTWLSAWITFTNFRARVTYRGHPETVTSYFHAWRIPQWSINEVINPTYNHPWSVVVREVVTKLNRHYFRNMPPAEVVRQEIAAIATQPLLKGILDVGFLGSSEALPTLERHLKTRTSGDVVVYALDAIGIIGDPKSFPFLQDFYTTARERGRLFSLKAIGDLGTPEALSFVRTQQPGDDDNLKEIIELYTY